MAFKTYVTDSLYLRDQGKTHTTRWIDVVRPKVDKDVDPQAVLNDLVERAGLVVE